MLEKIRNFGESEPTITPVDAFNEIQRIVKEFDEFDDPNKLEKLKKIYID